MQDGRGLLHQNRGFLAMPRIYDLDRMGVLAGGQAAFFQSMTMAIHACCSASSRSRYGDQPRRRSAIDTSAASAFSGTVKPALTAPASTILQWGRKRAKIYSGSWGFQTVFCVVTLITPEISIRDLGAGSNSAGPCPPFHRIYQHHLKR